MSSSDGGLVPIVFALLCVHPCRVSLDRATVWTCGSLKGTQRDCVGCVCCLLIASWCGCRPAPGIPTPSRWRASVHNQMSVVLRPHHVHNGPVDSRLTIAVVGRQWLPQPIGEGLGKRCDDPIAPLGYLRRCACGPLRSGVCTAWRHTLVMYG